MDVKSALIGLFMGMNKADKEILKSYLNEVPELSNNVAHHQEALSRHSLLRGVQLGKINEQDLKHHYTILERADEFWRNKYKEEFNFKMDTLGDNEDKYPIEFIISNTKVLLNEAIYNGNGETYTPVLINRYVSTHLKIENLCEQVYVKNLGGNERLIEFYIDSYKHKSLYKTLNNDRKLLNDITNIHSMILDEKISHKTICHGYEVDSFYKMMEHNGSVILKFKCNLIGKV